MNEPKISNCRSCGRQIVWMKTKAGKFMPVDAGTFDSTKGMFDPAIMRSHFVTCPQAGLWRKPK